MSIGTRTFKPFQRMPGFCKWFGQRHTNPFVLFLGLRECGWMFLNMSDYHSAVKIAVVLINDYKESAISVRDLIDFHFWNWNSVKHTPTPLLPPYQLTIKRGTFATAVTQSVTQENSYLEKVFFWTCLTMPRWFLGIPITHSNSSCTLPRWCEHAEYNLNLMHWPLLIFILCKILQNICHSHHKTLYSDFPAFRCVCVFEVGLEVCIRAFLFMCMRTCLLSIWLCSSKEMQYVFSVFLLWRMRFMRVFERWDYCLFSCINTWSRVFEDVNGRSVCVRLC